MQQFAITVIEIALGVAVGIIIADVLRQNIVPVLRIGTFLGCLCMIALVTGGVGYMVVERADGISGDLDDRAVVAVVLFSVCAAAWFGRILFSISDRTERAVRQKPMIRRED